MSYNPTAGSKLLGSVQYDPGTAATASCASLLAMTALDTTNLRVAITAPVSGKVRCYISVNSNPQGSALGIMLGVLDGSTVKLRQGSAFVVAAGTNRFRHDASGIISGLTPGNPYNFDLAYGVESVVASSVLGWGGPNNNTTATDAYGAAILEVWEVVT